MPIPDQPESEEPQADARLLEFIRERRQQGERQRRHQMLVVATAALGLIAVVLAISNALLIKRLMGRGPSTAVTAPAPSVASAPAVPAESAAPATRAPSPPPASTVAPPPVAPPSPVEVPAAATAPPAPRMDRPAVASPPPADIPAAAALSASSPSPAAPDTRVDRARRTARWLVQTHGRLEAENRAAKVAEFYGGEEGAFWRRVLLNVRQEPER